MLECKIRIIWNNSNIYFIQTKNLIKSKINRLYSCKSYQLEVSNKFILSKLCIACNVCKTHRLRVSTSFVFFLFTKIIFLQIQTLFNPTHTVPNPL